MTDRAPTWERPDAGAPDGGAGRRRSPDISSISSAPSRSVGAGRPRLRRHRAPVIAALDAGGDVFQREVRTMLVGSAALLVPIVALNLWVTVVGFDRFDPDDSFFPSLSSPSTTASGVEDVAPFVGLVAASVAAAVIGWFVAGVALDDRFARPRRSLPVHLGRTVRRVPSIVWLWLIGHWWQPLLALLVVSSDEEDLGGVVVTLGFIGWFAAAATLFAVPVAVTEQVGAVAALRRSWRLFRRSAGSTLGFVAASTALGSLYLVGLATLAPLLEANGFLAFGDSTWLVQGVLVQFGVILVMPLVAACTAQLYIEIRAEREGLDLALEADRVFGPVPGRDAVADGAPR